MSNNLEGLKNKEKDEELVNQAGEEKEDFADKIARLRDTLKLGPHHRMERFIILFVVLLFTLMSFTITAYIMHRSDLSAQTETQAIFNESFEFSLSGVQGSVEGVYSSDDRTDSLLLFNIENLNEMSADPDNYEFFITGFDGELQYEYNTSFGLFGSTGYGFIRFQNDEPIAKEIVTLTIRSNENLTTDQVEEASSEDLEDGSFAEHDQAEINFNPGADDTEVINNLGDGDIDPINLYTELVASDQDEEKQVEIYDEIESLDRNMKRSDEYVNRLTKAGYIPPEEPWFMKGDYIVEHSENIVPEEELDLEPKENQDFDIEYEKKVGKINSLELITSKDLDRAFDFDYQTKDIYDGYLNQVIDDMSEYASYMNQHSENYEVSEDSESDGEYQVEYKDSGEDELTEEVESIEEIDHEDGSTLNLESVVTGESPSDQVSAKDAVEELESIWNNYLQSKSTLQRELLRDLLILDADVQSQESGFAVNDDQELVHFY